MAAEAGKAVQQNKSVLLFALLVTLFVNLPQLVLNHRTNGSSPRLFSDSDEALYLPFALALGEHSVVELARNTANLDNAYVPLGYPTPHNLSELVAGKVAKTLGLSAVGLGLTLDFVCVLASYLIFFRVFRLITASDDLAHIATVFLLIFPGIFPLTAHLHVPFPAYFLLVPFAPFPCLPILRGLGTQLSYPLFGLVLLLVVRSNAERKKLLWAGIASGCLLYVYFFAWLVTLMLVTSLILIERFREKEAAGEQLLGDLVRFLVPAGLVSVPGILFIGHAKLEYFNQRALFASAPWYFPIEIVIIYLVMPLPKKLGLSPLVSGLLSAVALSEIVLVNAQKFLGISLQPYHFSVLYLHPLLSALCPLVILRFVGPQFHKLFSRVIIGTLALVCIMNVIQSSKVMSDESSFIELVGYLRANIEPGATVSVLPFTPPFAKVDGGLPDARLMPYWIWALSGHFGEPRYTGHGFTREDLEMRRELLIGKLFSGKAQLAGDCPADDKPRGDLLSENFSWHRTQRKLFCEKAKALVENYDICQALGELHPEYLLVESEFQSAAANVTEPEMSKVWESSDAKFQVFRVETERIMQDQCEIYADRDSPLFRINLPAIVPRNLPSSS